MSFFFGKGSKTKPQFTGLAAQTSVSSVPVTLLYGQNRIAPNIIWQGDFKTKKKKQKAGKGGPKITTYTYSASFQLALCWGEILDVTRVWKDQSSETSYAALGFSLFLGENPQAPWGYLTSNHPDEALGYPGIAHLSVANYDLGQSNGLAQHSFEVKGLLWGTGFNGIDADPAQMIDDFLTNPAHGVGFDTSVIDPDSFYSGPDASTTGDSAFQTYCTAMGFALSPALTSQAKAGETLDRWTMLCNTALVWTGYSLRFHPYGAEEVTGNGVTYIPDFPVRYMLNYQDFLAGVNEDPIRFNRVDPADASNSMSLIISNRENEYNDLPVPWRDQGLVDQYGRRQEDSLEAKEVCDPDMGAIIVAFIGQRKAYIRNTFEFRLSASYCRIEPMDVLGCFDPKFGQFYVLVKEVTEDDNGELAIVAEEYIESVSSQTSNVTQPVTNVPINTAADPGPVNPPLIFEPPLELSGTPQVWVAVSGGNGTVFNPNWGGCFVWLSTDDITYNEIGEVDTPARQGKLTAALPDYSSPNPDAVNTLSVSLALSGGELEDASADDAEAGATVSYVGGEFLSYQSVTLTGTNTYDLDNLWRGQYGIDPEAHSIDDAFARLDESIFKYDLPADYVGRTLYLKFQSFNGFGGGLQDLADCDTYTYTPNGSGFGTGTDGKPSVPVGLSASSGAGFVRVLWDANPVNDGVTRYTVYRAVGASQPFSSAVEIGFTSSSAPSYVDVTGSPGQAYSYFIVATNELGESDESAGINGTSSPSVPVNISLVFPFGETIGTYPIDLPITFALEIPDNFAGSNADVRTNPSSSTDFTVQVNSTTVGTITIGTSGTVTFDTTAGGLSLVAGDTLSITPPGSADATLAGVAFSISAQKVI